MEYYQIRRPYSQTPCIFDKNGRCLCKKPDVEPDFAVLGIPVSQGFVKGCVYCKEAYKKLYPDVTREEKDGTIYDSVEKPKHYASHASGVECIEITSEMNFCVGNAIKYLWRAGLKEDADQTVEEKHVEDLRKAKWYIEYEIKRLEKKLKNGK